MRTATLYHLVSAVLSIFIKIPGHAGMIWGQDTLPAKAATLSVPEPEADKAKEEDFEERWYEKGRKRKQDTLNKDFYNKNELLWPHVHYAY